MCSILIWGQQIPISVLLPELLSALNANFSHKNTKKPIGNSLVILYI